ncbi:MAG: hypothetical protein L6365_21480 [Desulfobulbaceae bacterium]|nr:hypothetical protein [Pseudomonadota bacterium]MCG2750092.1 hypothetical protein [Desulfobulbaceae bacterium]
MNRLRYYPIFTDKPQLVCLVNDLVESIFGVRSALSLGIQQWWQDHGKGGNISIGFRDKRFRIFQLSMQILVLVVILPGQEKMVRDSENVNLPGSRPDLGKIWLHRLSKTAGVAVLRRGFCD